MAMMKRAFALGLVLLMMLCASAAAQHAYWAADEIRARDCYEDRQGCEVLQMVMMGSFARFDPKDSLSKRVFAAVLPMLIDVQESDFAHFCAEFGVEEARLRRLYYIAMGNCALADILLKEESGAGAGSAEAAARVVIKLFLNPASALTGAEQMASIRAQLSDEDVASIAASSGLPADFVGYLMRSEDWQSLKP